MRTIRKQRDNKCVIIIFVGLALFVAFHWHIYNRAQKDAETVEKFINSELNGNGGDYDENSGVKDDGSEWFMVDYLNCVRRIF